MAADHLGRWDPWTPDDARRELAGCGARWWIGGGWAIDLFLGRATREHSDLDVALRRDEQHLVRAHLAAGGWDPHAADPPGELRPWPPGETLPAHVHDVWCRPTPTSPWTFQLMVDDVDDEDRWVFRRDDRIRMPFEELFHGRASDRAGVRVLRPEIQLLYKSRGMRPKDEADLAAVLPELTDAARTWLRDALDTVAPDHPWLARL